MSQEPEELSKWIQELVNRSSRQQIQALQRLSGLLQRVTSGELDQATVREEYTRFMREESASFVEDLTRLGLSFQTALLELNRKYSDRFFDQVLGSATRGRYTPHGFGEAEPSETNGHPPMPREIGIVLTGVAGEELVKSFVIENKRADEETVTFLVSEFADEVSGEAFRPPLQIQPPRLALRPGEERVVSIRLPLLTELFKPGRIYNATVLARGHADVVLALRVEISSPEIRVEVDPDMTDFTIREKLSAPTASLTPKERAAPVVRKPVRRSLRRRTAHKAAPDDLTQIKGIGQSYAAQLNAVGINTYAELAELDPAQLADILGETGYERAQRERWVEQALLAAGGQTARVDNLRSSTRSKQNGDRS